MSNKSIEEVLNYPFNVGIILKKKKEIKRVLLRQADFIDKRIAILGGSTTAEIKNILELFLLKEGIKPSFYESEYNRYYEDIMFDNTKLQMFRPEIIYIHTSNVNIVNYPELSDSAEEIQTKIYNEFSRYTSLWKKAAELYKCPIIQNNFELPATRTLGNLEFSDIHGKINYILRLNNEFAKFAQANNNFYINDIHYLSSWIGLEKWYNNIFWYSYKYALDYEAIPLLTHNISSIICSIFGKTKKCLVLDLDDTLWGGVVGDDGVEHIKIGKEDPVAEAYTAFQEYIKNIKERGVILAVCSKNNEEIASDGLRHPDSVLKKDDFSSFMANWNPKHINILEISKEINIGLDSLVFIDDSSMEREIVKSQIPQVKVLGASGNDVAKYIDMIDKSGYFEPVSITDDDKNRYKYYTDNRERGKYESKFESYKDFLESINMSAEIKCFEPLYLDRITKLINKTNQFNLTTKRYSFSEIEEISKSAKHISLYGKLKDKFGDNGLVSIIIGSIEGYILNIELWLMSCRVIKRDMEFAMFDKLVALCLQRGIKKIVGYYYKTSKNSMVSTHYENLGFKLVSEDENNNSIWKYKVKEKYHITNKVIEVYSG